jgi:NADP-dependent 3-hydroxy acid dehydrogenase YdfG
MGEERPTAVVTGASSGIGAATARALAAEGFHVVLGARRVQRCQEIADEIDGTAAALDVLDPDSVAAFAAAVPAARVLVNNAGGAKGFEPVVAAPEKSPEKSPDKAQERAQEDQWRWMWEANVLGTLRMTRALLPKLISSGDGVLVTVTSIAALATYDNGSGYTSAKHAQAAVHRTLRGEHLGQPVRFIEVAPGLVETEFSLVRFGGDIEQADRVYAGLTPLTAQDVAEVIAFAVTRPPHVNLDLIIVKPRDQYSAMRSVRNVAKERN